MTRGTSRLIRKALIPAAGFGTRLLPFSKAIPKEMLPIGNKPMIQHAVEEAVASGIGEIILVTAPGKTTIQKHFGRDLELETFLTERHQEKEAELVRSLEKLASIRVVCQSQPLGLGHAVHCARDLLAGEPFAMILPDAFIIAPQPCLRQLMDCYEHLLGSYVATREIRSEELGRFGILQVSSTRHPRWHGRVYHVTGTFEKPTPALTTSRFGIFGRYLFQPQIFDYLARILPDRNGEIQITDALGLYCRDHDLYGFCFEGIHYDIGNKLGYLQASVEMGLNDPEIANPFLQFLISRLPREAALAE